jgi:CDP-diacylglycerol--serine O-phosphatidyltransferase
MVSNLPLLSLKFNSFTIKKNIHIVVLAIIAIISAVLLRWLAVPVIFVAYILVSLVFKKQTS